MVGPAARSIFVKMVVATEGIALALMYVTAIEDLRVLVVTRRITTTHIMEAVIVTQMKPSTMTGTWFHSTIPVTVTVSNNVQTTIFIYIYNWTYSKSLLKD